MIAVCLLVGWIIEYFTGLYWLTATFMMMIVVLIDGLIIFNEDLEDEGFYDQEGAADTPRAKAEQSKANKIQVAVIFLLLIGAVWS